MKGHLLIKKTIANFETFEFIELLFVSWQVV